MEKDIILHGVHIGEHSFESDKIIDEINERCIKPGFNFVTLRLGSPLRNDEIPQQNLIDWAKYLAENKIYFTFLYTVQHAPDGRSSFFDKETVLKMKEIAGDYFLGDMIGETGSSFACKMKGYFNLADLSAGTDKSKIKIDYVDMKEAHEGYVESIKKYIATNKELEMPDILSVEATGLNKYNAEAGVTIPMLELMCGNPDILVSSLRGVARSIDSKIWGTYIAHEWYGGMRHSDTLKRKRLELAYKYAYLSGSNALCLESGDEKIQSYGHIYEQDNELCKDYRDILDYMAKLIKTDSRPKGGPKVKLAFVSGLHDAWGGWGGSSMWNQFDRKEWGHSDAEYSWRILDDIGTKRRWNDVANYGESDYSASPAYGMYDIVPIEAPLEKLSHYDYLIFLGWNSMTDEIIDKLTQYVKQGGRLLMSAAHLNKAVKRDGSFDLIPNEKISALFGCSFTGEIVSFNGGIKFNFDSVCDDILYPGTKSFVCDPVYSAGYTDYAKFDLCGGVETAFVSDSFANKGFRLPALIENKLGNGVATLITSACYPGNPALYPFYNAVVREMVSASARNCDIKVLSSDRLRYSVYDSDKIYLLNTDYDMPITAKIIKGSAEHLITLNPLELKSVEV